MDSENILRNLVRIGTVSSVDPAKRTARVIFKDKDMVSGWLSRVVRTMERAFYTKQMVNTRMTYPAAVRLKIVANMTTHQRNLLDA